MKRILLSAFCITFVILLTAAQTVVAPVIYKGSFKLDGNTETYYPVAFHDNLWWENKASVLELGRSDVHLDNQWHGSLIAKFTFHTNHWGHASQFIDAYIRQLSKESQLIADYTDATINNTGSHIVIWLRGATTYFYHSTSDQPPVYTNASITLGENTYDIKTEVSPTINFSGLTQQTNLWVNGPYVNHFAGDVGIGTTTPKSKLDVNGIIHSKGIVSDGTIKAREVKVQSDVWSDFVFEPGYKLATLEEVNNYINTNRHLPDIPPASEVIEEGINVAEMQVKLLQKIEELTLYTISQEKRLEEQEKLIRQLQSIISGK